MKFQTMLADNESRRGYTVLCKWPGTMNKLINEIDSTEGVYERVLYFKRIIKLALQMKSVNINNTNKWNEDIWCDNMSYVAM